MGAIDLEVDDGAQGFEFEQVFTEFPGPGDSKEDLNHNKLSYLQKRKNARKMLEMQWGQVIYLPKIFRIDEKLEFRSDNSTTMTNNIPDPTLLL